MKTNFAKCMKVVEVFEGGYVNHPKDPGGATNLGVTQAVYDSYRKKRGQKTQTVKSITNAERDTIFRFQYWDPCQGDSLPIGLDLAVFDYAINSGVGRATRSLQKMIGAKEDGQLGYNTLKSVQLEYDFNKVELIRLYCEDRFAFVKKLSTFSTFGKGWTRRIMGTKGGVQATDNGIIDLATMMAMNETVPTITATDLTAGKANTTDVKIQSTAEGTASGTAGVGLVAEGARQAGVGTVIGDSIMFLGEQAGFAKEQIEPFVAYSSYIQYAFIALGIIGVIGVVAVRMKKQRDGTVEA